MSRVKSDFIPVENLVSILVLAILSPRLHFRFQCSRQTVGYLTNTFAGDGESFP